jgi:polyisoprenoid-binding protein YceI
MPVSTQPWLGTFVADPIHSNFRFTVRHMGVSKFSAGFDDVDVRATASDEGVHLEGAIRVQSLSIKLPDFRNHVLDAPNFFDAPHHPEMTFRSDDVSTYEDGTARIQGELTIKGITKPFTATGTYEPVVEDPFGNQRTAVEFEAVVDRRDWGFTFQAPLPKGGDSLGWQVMLTAHVELIKEA